MYFAGRDGKPSRAILLYSFADRRNHEWFHARDYPDTPELDRIYRALTPEPQIDGQIRKRLGMDEELFERALEKLWIHGGALIDADGNVAVGSAGWQKPYLAQRDHAPATVLCTLTVEDHTSASGMKRYMLGGEPILTRDGGTLTDGHGHHPYVTTAGSAP